MILVQPQIFRVEQVNARRESVWRKTVGLGKGTDLDVACGTDREEFEIL